MLDEILSEADIQTEQNMGLVQVPLDFVVGTSTMGRTYSFAANFMPILDEETEFAVTWSHLSDAQKNVLTDAGMIIITLGDGEYIATGSLDEDTNAIMSLTDVDFE